MALDGEVENGASSSTATRNGNFIKSLIIGVLVVVVGLTTVLLSLRFTRSTQPSVKSVEEMPSTERVIYEMRDDNSVLAVAEIPDKVNDVVEEIHDNVKELTEPLAEDTDSDASIDILKEVLGNMDEYIDNDVDDTLEPFIDIDAPEIEMPTPRIMDIFDSSTPDSVESVEDFDTDADLRVPDAFLGDDSEEMSENPTMEEISSIVKKIIQGYKERGDIKGFGDSDESLESIQDESEFDSGIEDQSVDEDIVENIDEFRDTYGEPNDQVIQHPHDDDQPHPFIVSNSHNIHDYLSTMGFRTIGLRFDQTHSNDNDANQRFTLTRHKMESSESEDIDDNVFHQQMIAFTNSKVPQSQDTSKLLNGNFLIGNLEDIVEDTEGLMEKVAEVNDGVIDKTGALEHTLSGILNQHKVVQSILSESANKAIAPESTFDEIISNSDLKESPLAEAADKVGATGSVPVSSTKIVATVSPLSEIANKSVAIEPPLGETVETAVEIESSRGETVDKTTEIVSPVSETAVMNVDRSDANDTEKAIPRGETVDKTTEIVSSVSETVMNVDRSDANDTEKVIPLGETVDKTTEIVSSVSETAVMNVDRSDANDTEKVIPLLGKTDKDGNGSNWDSTVKNNSETAVIDIKEPDVNPDIILSADNHLSNGQH